MSDEMLDLEQDPMDYGHFFVPIAKVDEEKREVYGFATVEEPDTANEVMDYATSKPYFVDWSNQAQKRSKGKSLGNLRSMHSNIAAGKLISLQPDDAHKSIFIGAKVVSDSEWEMVKEGVYTGFSVGGRYVKRWYDNGFMRYTAQPMEISLVDSPAVRSATFQMVKSDGTVEDRTFKKVAEQNPQGMTADDTKILKSPDTFSPVTININMIPGSNVLQAAGVPGQQEVNMNLAPASPATDNGATPPGQNEAAYKNEAPGEDAMTAEEQNRLARLEKAVDDLVQALSANATGAKGAPENRGEIADAVGGKQVQAAPDYSEEGMDGEVVAAGRMLGVNMVQKVGRKASPSSSDSTSTEPDSDDTTGPSTAPTTKTVPKAAARKAGTSAPTGADSVSDATASDTSAPTTKPAKTSATSAPVKKDEEDSDLEKNGENMADQNEPMATVPTSPMILGTGQSVVETALPAFMKAMEGGSLRAAQKVVREINGGDFDQQMFDEMFVKAQHKLLMDGGWTYQNLRSGRLNNHEQSIDPTELKKAISFGDIPNIYLIRLLKLMLPLYAGLRRRLASNPPPVGADKAQWRAELGYSNFDFAAAMSVAEASTGGSVNESFLTFISPFRRSSLNDSVTLEAVYATRGYDDPLQIAVIRALTLLLGTEERMILGGNSGSLSAPTVTMTPSGTGGTLAAGSYIPYVTALTYRGWLGTSKAGSPAGYGETTAGSAAQTVTTGTTSSLALTWPAVKGAVAYNVYVSQNGTSRFVATVNVNTYTVTAFPGAGASQPAADTSANTNGYEGIIQWADQSTIYSNAIPNKTFIDQAGSGLTTYAGGISEFDTLLSALWTNWQIAPSLILTSPNGVKHLTKQLLSTSQVSAYRVEVGSERGQISGGMFVTGYTNKFAPYADGTPRVLDIMAHPYMPDGSFKFLSESIPYPMARESRGFVLETLIPYTYFPLAQNDIRYPFSMLFSETLECFHPGAQAAINGVDFTK